MENAMLGDTLKTSCEGEEAEDKKEEEEEEASESTQPNSTSSPDSPKAEDDARNAWRSSQVVEEEVKEVKKEVTTLPPSMKDLPAEESTVRRRRGKEDEDTTTTTTTEKSKHTPSKLTNNTHIDTFITPDTLNDEDNSPEAQKLRKKKKKIQEVLSSEPLDLKALKDLAISSGGLVDDTLRREAWPLLMGLGRGDAEVEKPAKEVVEGHRDYQQVVLDVKRTLKRFPPGIEDNRRLVLMDQLTVLIIRVLMRHPYLYYYQGYHDVAITFLLVTGEDMGFRLVEKLSVTHLKDFMGSTMEKTNYYLTYLYPILERANPTLYDCLVKSGVDTVFCLPWLITWFAHTLSDYRHVVRLYDFFLASHDLMPMYIATAIVLQKEKELLAEEEQEVCAIFSILSRDPDNLPFEDILVKARELYERYPPGPLKDDVDTFIVKRKERERMESERIAEMRRRADIRNKQPPKLVDRILAFVPMPLVVPQQQRRNLFKLALFAASILVARSLYKNYYTSAVEYSATVLD